MIEQGSVQDYFIVGRGQTFWAVLYLFTLSTGTDRLDQTEIFHMYSFTLSFRSTHTHTQLCCRMTIAKLTLKIFVALVQRLVKRKRRYLHINNWFVFKHVCDIFAALPQFLSDSCLVSEPVTDAYTVYNACATHVKNTFGAYAYNEDFN